MNLQQVMPATKSLDATVPDGVLQVIVSGVTPGANTFTHATAAGALNFKVGLKATRLP